MKKLSTKTQQTCHILQTIYQRCFWYLDTPLQSPNRCPSVGRIQGLYEQIPRIEMGTRRPK